MTRDMPTLERNDLLGYQIPGLVDVAEELVAVGLWEGRSSVCHLPQGALQVPEPPVQHSLWRV